MSILLPLMLKNNRQRGVTLDKADKCQGTCTALSVCWLSVCLQYKCASVVGSYDILKFLQGDF